MGQMRGDNIASVLVNVNANLPAQALIAGRIYERLLTTENPLETCSNAAHPASLG